MVHLIEVAKNLKTRLTSGNSLQRHCYNFIFGQKDPPATAIAGFVNGEQLACKGYLGMAATDEEVSNVITKRPIKQIDFSTNIFKLLGIALVAKNSVFDRLKAKFNSSSLKYKFLISKVFPEFSGELNAAIAQATTGEDLFQPLLAFLYQNPNLDITDSIKSFLAIDQDIVDLILLESIIEALLKRETRTEVVGMNAFQAIIQVLEEFDNAVRKITQSRRKDHKSFEINDEYDVQDILYVMLKPIFKTMICEDPTPKIGVKSNKIDLIIRNEGILIETKMMKAGESEKKYVEELKNDIQSYFECKYLRYLIMFVYDPFKGTSDAQNFYALSGIQEIQGTRFEIKVLVG